MKKNCTDFYQATLKPHPGIIWAEQTSLPWCSKGLYSAAGWMYWDSTTYSCITSLVWYIWVCKYHHVDKLRLCWELQLYARHMGHNAVRNCAHILWYNLNSCIKCNLHCYNTIDSVFALHSILFPLHSTISHSHQFTTSTTVPWLLPALVCVGGVA